MKPTLIAAALLQFVDVPSAFAQVKAFPTAEGFGANAKGGRGGRVIEVTNLNDSGPGSLRACAEATGPRICVFRVGGTIALSSPIAVREANSYLTIAGQTAPGGGIQIKNRGLYITNGAHDVVVRHFRVRQGTDHQPQDINNECEGVLIYSPNSVPATHDVIIDHASIEWVCDDSAQSYGNTYNVTYQWSLIGEGLTPNDYKNLQGQGANSKGANPGGGAGPWTFHHNLFIHTGSRNPYSKGGAGGVTGTLDWRNNLGYNWNACHGNVSLGEYHEYGQFNNDASLRVNFVGNKYIAGPNTSLGCFFGSLGGDQTKVFIQDNINPFCVNGCSTLADMKFFEQNGTTTTFAPIYPVSDSKLRSMTPFPAPAVTMTPASALEAVLTSATSGAGATRPARDSLDARLISELLNRTGDLGRNGAPWPVLASGPAAADADRDGMPDAWELAHGLDPNSAADGPLTSSNGYTNLENYLNELAGDPVPGFSAPPSAGPLTVAFAAPVQGQVVIASGVVAAGAPRADLPVTVKAANAVKIELSRDAANPDCPSCGTPFFTWNAPTSGTDTYSITMCANCFNLAESLPRQMTLHAVAYDGAGGKKQADVTVFVTNQSGPATDLNRDGRTDVADVQLAVNQALVPGTCGAGDVNRDGACDVADVQLVVNKCLGV